MKKYTDFSIISRLLIIIISSIIYFIILIYTDAICETLVRWWIMLAATMFLISGWNYNVAIIQSNDCFVYDSE